MRILDVVEIVGKIREMEVSIGQVTDKELQQKLKENFKWLTEYGECQKIDGGLLATPMTQYYDIP